MMDIDEKQLEELLIKAYEEGWYGSKDLAGEISKKIILDFQNKQKSQTPKKKRAKKKQLTNSITWGNLDAVRMEGNSITFDGRDALVSYGSGQVADRDRGRRVSHRDIGVAEGIVRGFRSSPQSYVEAEAEAVASSMARIQASLPGSEEAVYGVEQQTIERRNEATRIAAEVSTRLEEAAESIEMVESALEQHAIEERTISIADEYRAAEERVRLQEQEQEQENATEPQISEAYSAVEQQAVDEHNEFVEMASATGMVAEEAERLERVTRPIETQLEHQDAIQQRNELLGYTSGPRRTIMVERPSEPNPCMEVDIDDRPSGGWQRYFPSSFVEETTPEEVVVEETRAIGSEAAAEESTEVDL